MAYNKSYTVLSWYVRGNKLHIVTENVSFDFYLPNVSDADGERPACKAEERGSIPRLTS